MRKKFKFRNCLNKTLFHKTFLILPYIITFNNFFILNSFNIYRAYNCFESNISVTLYETVIGTLKLSELPSEKSIDSIQVDDELEFMITNVDKKSQNISLSMKALEKQNEDKVLNEYNKNNESVGSSLGDIYKEQIDK